MRILLLCHGFNSLTQRLHCDLRAAGHEVSVEFDVNDAVTAEAVSLFQPDLILAPFLKRAIPAEIFEKTLCLIVHPGPVGDRGPSALDWAVLEDENEWGVTVLQAVKDLDAGPIWAHRSFPLRKATKSSLYRHEVTDAAASAVFEALEKLEAGVQPEPLDPACSRWRPTLKQSERAINWETDTTATVLQKIRSADGMPGLLDNLFDEPVRLFDARPFDGPIPSSLTPGTPFARSGPALALKTTDGALWIGHGKKTSEKSIKLPMTQIFEDECVDLPELADGYKDILFEIENGVGYLHFDFYNGAMGTEACRRLKAAFEKAAASPAKVLVLMGGPDHWSNGLNLNLIEAARSPAEESWQNIRAIDDLAEAVIRTTGKWIISGLRGNAGAGGVFLARAADAVWVRPQTILNPHYKDMGNLYGSEYWTYLLPKYAGPDNAARISEARLPMGAEEALSLGLADQVLRADQKSFEAEIRERASALAKTDLTDRLQQKAETRQRDEAVKPLEAYRAAELAKMRKNFFGFDPSYHVARYNFVRKVVKSRTPRSLAHHRSATPGPPATRRVLS
ncbi:enoyl-CoA hydratase-related protein [Roseibium sp.]|uniref:enoyl-CoA hydratase-related protein n=1 Tax=Roseibium sp. TaxID=1936156 RepID=UPI003B521839